MDAVVKPVRARETEADDARRPSRDEAEAAVRVLLRYIGENPDREGLVETPRRFVRAYDELFSGYRESAEGRLERTFEEVSGYDDMVVVRDISFYSHCEHHMVPIIGRAHIGYIPDGRVVGLSKLARVVDVFARRLQTQENLTAQIADAIDATLKPRGVAVMVEGEHLCMAMRGVEKMGSSTVTTRFTGGFLAEPAEQVRFISLVRKKAE